MAKLMRDASMGKPALRRALANPVMLSLSLPVRASPNNMVKNS
jgi:hypothetical protein